MTDRDQDLRDELLVFLRGLDEPITGAGAVAQFAATRRDVDSGSIRLALMHLLDERAISLDSNGWTLSVRSE